MESKKDIAKVLSSYFASTFDFSYHKLKYVERTFKIVVKSSIDELTVNLSQNSPSPASIYFTRNVFHATFIKLRLN